MLGVLAGRNRGAAPERGHRPRRRPLPRRSPATPHWSDECGLEILVETARLWVSHGHHNSDGVWHIDGVTGPDEYSAVADDNVFTNLMAARNLRAAADACARRPKPPIGWCRPGRARGLAAAADAVYVPYDERLGVHPQSQGFTRYADWDFAASRPHSR